MRSTSTGPTRPTSTTPTSGPRATRNNSELGASGLPQGAELELLERYRGRIRRRLHRGLRSADLRQRGGVPQQPAPGAHAAQARPGGRSRTAAPGPQRDRPTVRVRVHARRAASRARHPAVRPEPGAARHQGRPCAMSMPAQYQNRRTEFRLRHDSTINRPEPRCARQRAARLLGSSAAADTPGSRNLAGIKDPVVDELVELIIQRRDPPGAGDRVRAPSIGCCCGAITSCRAGTPTPIAWPIGPSSAKPKVHPKLPTGRPASLHLVDRQRQGAAS